MHALLSNFDLLDGIRGDTQNVYTIKKLDAAKIIGALRLISESVKMPRLAELLG
jgi:hypothetical protein